MPMYTEEISTFRNDVERTLSVRPSDNRKKVMLYIEVYGDDKPYIELTPSRTKYLIELLQGYVDEWSR